MREKVFLVYFNLSLVCVLLVGIELIGQLSYVAWKGYPLYDSDRHVITPQQVLFERHPYLVARLQRTVSATDGDKVVTTTDIHTRWTGADPGDSAAIRIAVVGGSTTFGSGVSDADTWPARLQAHLGRGYAVINYGFPGYSTAEGIIQMALLIPEGRPDVVVLYEGWNDIRNYHQPDLGPDYYSHGMSQYKTQNIEIPPPPSAFAKLVSISAIGRLANVLAWKVFGNSTPRRQAVAPDATVMANAATTVFDSPDSFVDGIYLRNLKTLKLLAGQLGAYIIFVPQVLDSSRFVGGQGSHSWTPHVKDEAMPGLLRRFNAIMNQVCRPGERHCEVFADVDSQTWPTEDFLDEGHFLRAGNEAFASLLAARITVRVNDHSIRPRAPQIRPSGLDSLRTSHRQ